MRRTLRTLAALAILALLAGPSALPAAPPPAPTGLPSGVHPLSPGLAKHMDELVHAAEEYRGLRLKRPVPYGALDLRGLKAKVAESIEEDLPAEQMRVLALSLQAFGLVPEGADVGKIYRDILGQQVAAFYDPERKYLAMVERPGENGADALGKAFGTDRAHRAEEGILVHELTHAIDDQHFDIAKGTKGDPLVDGSAAFLGLVEGDATVTMFDYILGKRVEAVPGFGRVMAEMMKDPGQLAALSPDLPGSAGLADAPAWFRDTLIFSYLQGFSFCLDVERVGGQKLLDYAFAKDPPRSTEQLLHPEKWRGRRDDPIGLTWPDLSSALPGWKKGAEGQMGEEGIGILLRQELKDPKLAATAAAGWGGDRFAVYEKDGKRLLFWATEWDTEADAADFQAAATRLPQGGAGWKVARLASTRVMLTRGGGLAGIGGIGGEQQSKVEAALAAVQAERPANRDIDFAALGITPKREEKPPKELHTDGRTFTDRAAGFSIRLPAAHEGWAIVPEPDEKGGVRLVQGDKGAIVGVRVGDLTTPVRLEDALPTLGKPALERTYVHGTKRITVAAFVPGLHWKEMEGAIREIFDSFTLLP
jgi:hypothetical protein